METFLSEVYSIEVYSVCVCVCYFVVFVVCVVNFWFLRSPPPFFSPKNETKQ